MANRRKPVMGIRKVWRMSSDAPLGQIVDIDPTEPEPAKKPPDPAPVVIEPAPAANWRASSWDLLTGLDVIDHSESIPGELFDKLFKR
jgi:hypothetical protein